MGLTPVKTPKVVKSLLPNYIWDIPSDKKEIYLTFDDGPTPEVTEWVLELLKTYNAKATFFCIGNNVEKYPSVFQAVVKEGHFIGNHTYNHLKGWKHKTKAYLNDIQIAEQVFKSQNITTSLFRPPYGKLKPKQGKGLHKLGYKIVMWDVLSFDWDKNVSREQCLKNVLDNTTSGSIIVFHDSIKAKYNLEYTLPRVLEHYATKGYTFKTINT